MTARRRRRSVVAAAAGVALAAMVVAACSSSSSSSSSGTGAATTTVAAPALTVVVDGLDHPTQIADGPGGLLLVAELAGDEEAGTGEVLAIDVATKRRRVLATGLDKPTGVLWSDGVLWIMVRRGLLRATWPDAAATPGPTEVVLHDLPFNDRSEGTLTALGDGRLLYETTGSLTNGVATTGSGTLWIFDPVTVTSTPLAVGLKNGYAHTVLADGRVATADIGDNIADAPVEEVDVLPAAPTSPPADLGWPRCPGDTDCAGVVRPLATFPVAATPTGVTSIGTDVYVTLFVTGQLMRVPLAGWTPGAPPVAPVLVADGLDGPHTVLARPDGSLWVSEHLAGRIVSLRP